VEGLSFEEEELRRLSTTASRINTPAESSSLLKLPVDEESGDEEGAEKGAESGEEPGLDCIAAEENRVCGV
jgi:hypothetical protein